MLSSLARRARPCDVSAPETAKAPPTPRARERPERSGGPRRGKNLQRSGREEAGLSGRGNCCPAEVGGGGCGIQRPKRHAGTGLPKPRGSEHRASARSISPVDSGHRTSPNPEKLPQCGELRPTPDGDNLRPLGDADQSALVEARVRRRWQQDRGISSSRRAMGRPA
jgi:hypothetical protein